MKRLFVLAVGAVALALSTGTASAYYPYFFGAGGYYGSPFYAPYGGFGYSPYFGGYGGYGMPYGGYYGGYAYGAPYMYGYSYGPVISSTTSRGRSRYYEEFAGPPARARSNLYPAVTYAEFAAYEQQRTTSTDEQRALIIVRVPIASTRLEINGKQMTQGGTERTFQTPLLPSASKQYTFELKASWSDDLGPRTQATTIQVRAGETYLATFPLQAAKDR